MRLSVIVPRYAHSKEVADLWDENRRVMEAVAEVPTEIVVIDNGSTVPAAVEDGRYLKWPVNRGIAPAWNEGARFARGGVLAFVTTAVTVEPGWDTKLCEVAEAGRFIAMPFTNGEKPYGLGPTGWCFAVARGVFHDVGPFDETFVPIQYEDVDWMTGAIYRGGCEAVNVIGANVRRVPQAGGTHDAPWAKRRHLIHWSNRFRYAFKWNLDPNDVPPFWKAPLRDVDAPPGRIAMPPVEAVA